MKTEGIILMPKNDAPEPKIEGVISQSEVDMPFSQYYSLPKLEAIDHPAHYAGGGIEVIDALEAWQLDFHLGNVVKYIARAGKKGDLLQDLKKAQWYLARRIAQIEKG